MMNPIRHSILIIVSVLVLSDLIDNVESELVSELRSIYVTRALPG